MDCGARRRGESGSENYGMEVRNFPCEFRRGVSGIGWSRFFLPSVGMLGFEYPPWRFQGWCIGKEGGMHLLGFMSPLRGWTALCFFYPGRCSGLPYFAPSGLNGILYTATLKMV